MSALGHITRVATDPGSVVRSFSDFWHSWDEIRSWRVEIRERALLSPSHTFSRLPGFFPRPAEMETIESTLEEEPCFTVLFGGSSVGKTALLREILCSDKYHVLHFDLRIAGFADIDGLYISLSQQMEQYFVDVSKGARYEDFEKEAWRYKHDRADLERRPPDTTGRGRVRTSDIARLMELFQSSLLKYREFDPSSVPKEDPDCAVSKWSIFYPKRKASKPKPKWPLMGWLSKPPDLPVKKRPVFFLDEAHKLPKLVQPTDKSTDTMKSLMKSLLDSMLILTKQDRLCHVVHSTSDPFYQNWLRDQNVMQHCKLITIGDCSKSETRHFFEERMLAYLPEHLRPTLDFEQLYDAFGGRLIHWQDFITDYDNSKGTAQIQTSSHFMQAHALVNLNLIQSSVSSELTRGLKDRRSSHRRASRRLPTSAPPAFTALQLLSVLTRLTDPRVHALSYFTLCRELGPAAVDAMVRARILDLRWIDPVTREGGADERGEEEVFGPKVVPAMPIMRHAMKRVVQEYRDTIAAFCAEDMHDACPPGHAPSGSV